MPRYAKTHVGRPVRCDDVAVGEKLTRVVKEQNAVAQEAPSLLGMSGHGPRPFPRRVVRRGTSRSVAAVGLAYQFHLSSVHCRQAIRRYRARRGQLSCDLYLGWPSSAVFFLARSPRIRAGWL